MTAADDTSEAAARTPRRASRIRRAGVVLLAAGVLVTTAVGPSRLAAAVGVASSAPAASPRFRPEPTPVIVRAPSLVLSNLSGIFENQPIPLAGGGNSPSNTILLQFASIDLNNLSITQSKAGPFSLAITNPGSTATIGGPGETSDLWGVLNKLQLCLTLTSLTTLAHGLPVVGGLLGDVLGLINGLVPAAVNNSLPCFDIDELLPILAPIVNAGILLPLQIPANNLDIDVYALDVHAPGGSTSLQLPTANLVVQER